MSMCVDGTPVEHHPDLGLWVKREDLCCPPGPHFSKTRGVYAHVASRPERVIGVLDTHHSQGGWAVAQACRMLHKQCVEYYPVRRATPGWRGEVQDKCVELGAKIVPLQAGRSAVLYHQARRDLPLRAAGATSYMMPNALKLPEMITETVAEVRRTALPEVETVLVSASSGTIAAGLWRGLWEAGWCGTLVVHMGYSRSEIAVRDYMVKMSFGERPPLDGEVDTLYIDEGYAYGDHATPGCLMPPFPCNEYYDLKAFRWWVTEGRERFGEALLWNIG